MGFLHLWHCPYVAAPFAEQLGMFAYAVVGDTLEITGFPTGEGGDIDRLADTTGRLSVQ